MKLTNNASGPRSVNTSAGYVTIPAGQTVDVGEVADADLKAIKAAGVLDEAEIDPAAPRSIPGYPNLALPEARAAEQALDVKAEKAGKSKDKPESDEK